MSQFDDDLTLALRSAPELYQDPNVALAATTAGGDVQANAEVTAHANNTVAAQNAFNGQAQKHGGPSVLSRTMGWLGGGFHAATSVLGEGLSVVGHIANKPLQEVQHEYRYLRDVASQHGSLVAIAEGLAIGAAAVGAGVLTGGMGSGAAAGLVGTALGAVTGYAGAKLGGEAAGYALGQVAYNDSWKRTASATYVDPHGGQPVSPGRDLARLVGSLGKHIGVHVEQHGGFDLFDAISSAGDGLFDLGMDPLAQAGELRGVAKGAEGFSSGPLAARWGGRGMAAEQVAKASVKDSGVIRAFEHMASTPNTPEGVGSIIKNYPKFRAFAPMLAEADSVEKVGQVFVDHANAAEMISKTLPSRSVPTETFQAMRSKLLNYEGPGQELVRKATTFQPVAWDKATLELSTKKFDFHDTLNGPQNIYKMARLGHNEATAQAVAGQFALGTLPERMTIFRNVMTDNLAKRMDMLEDGLSASEKGADIIKNVASKIDSQLGGVDAGIVNPQYGFGVDGRTLSQTIEKGGTVARPILEGDLQHVTVDMPEYHDFDRNLKSLSKFHDMYGKVDDFAYDHFTKNVFKKWVLASGGFALRVASGELLPQIMRDPAGLLQSKVAATAAKHGWSMTPQEGESVVAVLGRFMADKGVGLSDERIAYHVEGMHQTGGHIVPSAASAGHGFHQEIIGTEQYVDQAIGNGLKEIPVANRTTDNLSGWGALDKEGNPIEEHADFWQKNLQDIAGSPASRAAAAEYHAALTEGAGTKEATRRAVAKAKETLDGLPEEMLNASPRHFASTVDERIPGRVATGKYEWVPGTKEVSGHYEFTGETEMVGRTNQQGSLFPTAEAPETKWVPGTEGVDGEWVETGQTAEAGQWTAQPNLVNPGGSVPSGMRTGTEYGGLGDPTEGPQAGFPAKTTYKEKKWVPGEKGKDGHWEFTGKSSKHGMETAQGSLLPGTEVQKTRYVPGTPEGQGSFSTLAPEEFGPQLLEQGRLGDIMPPDPHEDWARVIVENLRGATHAPNDIAHMGLLDSISKGETPALEDLKAIPHDARPLKVLGPIDKPAASRKLSDRIFDKLNKTVNWIAREPIFADASWNTYEAAYKGAVARGELSFEEAVSLSQQKATMQMLPHIHNVTERTLMADTMKNWVPFYFAQQQSYARAYRLLAEEPAAFRRVQLAYSNLADFGGLYGDSGGNNQFVIPGAGFLTSGAMKAMGLAGIPVINSLPTAFSGNLKSLASLSPFLEGGDVLRAGPLVALGARAINNLIPETKALTDPVLGSEGSSQSMLDMLIPNSAARSVLDVFNKGDNRSMNKSVLDAIQSLEYQQNVAMTKWTKDGSKGEPPTMVPGPDASDLEKEKFLERIKSHARITTVFKAILQTVSPVAPSLQLGNYKLVTELRDDIGKKGITQALSDFLITHPDASPFEVFQTDSLTASPIQSNHPAQQWVTNNSGFLNNSKYTAASSYFVPQTSDKFEQSVYNEQMAMGLRKQKAPDQLLKDVYVAEGNRKYYDDYKVRLDAAMGKATSPHQRDAIRAQFKPDLEAMKLQNPTWYGVFSSGARDNERALAVSQLKTMYQAGQAPDSPMTPLIGDLLKDYDAHQAAMVPGRTDTYASAQRKAEEAKWQQHLKDVGDSQPQLTMIINNVFRGL